MPIKSDFSLIQNKLDSLPNYQEKLKYLEECLFKRKLALSDFMCYSFDELERLKIKTANDFEKWNDGFDKGDLFVFHELTNKHHEKRLGLDSIKLLEERITLENQYKNIVKQIPQFEDKIKEVEKAFKNKAERILDTDFINGIRKVSFPVVVPMGDTFIQYFEIEKNGEIRRFGIVQYLDLIAEIHYLSCDEKKTLNEKLTILYDAEFSLKDIIREYRLDIYNCDYSKVLQRLSDCIKLFEKQNVINNHQSHSLASKESPVLIVQSESKPKRIAEKWYALLYWLELNSNGEQLPTNLDGSFIRKEIEAKGRTYPNIKKGQSFYRAFIEIKLNNEKGISDSFSKNWKEEVIKLSDNNENVISYIHQKYNSKTQV